MNDLERAFLAGPDGAQLLCARAAKPQSPSGKGNPCYVHLAPLGAGLLLLLACGHVRGAELDFSRAVLVSAPGLTGPEQKALVMLVEEVEKRTGIRWETATNWPAPAVPVIAAGLASGLEAFAGAYATELKALPECKGAEGFRLSVRTNAQSAAVFILGNDSRGLLFGAGRLLRELRMSRGRVSAASDLAVATAPRYALRGHQLGYRPKCNSYDAWDLPVWEQYFRDLAVFGCNAIELIPPRSDDDPDSPHFPRSQMDMMRGMSRVADAYGLDVWVWYPAMEKDYADPKTVESALREWGEVFAALSRVDAVFVPGGDPGHTAPKVMMALLAKQTENLHRYHPKAQMWMSPQGFNQQWLDEFIEILKRDSPDWLSGVVFGPQVRVSAARLRELVPARYPIRHYPDITHSRQCQYPVPDWDVAYALTEARECINPRPEGEATIFKQTQPSTIGFLSYSEGCNDDVNKMVWSALGWDPETPVIDILRQFSRYFIGERYTDAFAQGLLSLERNWKGPLLANQGVETTLAQFQDLERAASPADLKNWRFQQALFRAYYDAYIRHRLIWETELESRAMERLRAAPDIGAPMAMNGAEAMLNRAMTERVNADWRERILQLGEALFQSIGMQLSVKYYQAIAVDRGASLDTLDYPLNNRAWLKERFRAIRKLPQEPDRLKALQEIVQWTDPGPGGFYDDLGNPARQPHWVPGLSFDQDPGRFASSRADFEEDLVVDEPDETAGIARRISWMDHVESLYDEPLRMHYAGLDPQGRYKLRVIYGGDNPKRKLRLAINDDVPIHGYIPKPVPFRPLEFELPPGAAAKGELTLNWYGEPGLGGNGRNCQVSEVWLIKEPASSAP